MENRLRKIFSDMVVYKDLKNSNFFSALSLPSFMRDWPTANLMQTNFPISYGDLFRKKTIGKRLRAALLWKMST